MLPYLPLPGACSFNGRSPSVLCNKLWTVSTARRHRLLALRTDQPELAKFPPTLFARQYQVRPMVYSCNGAVLPFAPTLACPGALSCTNRVLLHCCDAQDVFRQLGTRSGAVDTTPAAKAFCWRVNDQYTQLDIW